MTTRIEDEAWVSCFRCATLVPRQGAPHYPSNDPSNRRCSAGGSMRLTPAQQYQLREILSGGQKVSIRTIDRRVRKALEARALLPWAGQHARDAEVQRLVYAGLYGQVDRAELVRRLTLGGCGECATCQEIMVEPTQVGRGLFCPFARGP